MPLLLYTAECIEILHCPITTLTFVFILVVHIFYLIYLDNCLTWLDFLLAKNKQTKKQIFFYFFEVMHEKKFLMYANRPVASGCTVC